MRLKAFDLLRAVGIILKGVQNYLTRFVPIAFLVVENVIFVLLTDWVLHIINVEARKRGGRTVVLIRHYDLFINLLPHSTANYVLWHFTQITLVYVRLPVVGMSYSFYMWLLVTVYTVQNYTAIDISR